MYYDTHVYVYILIDQCLFLMKKYILNMEKKDQQDFQEMVTTNKFSECFGEIVFVYVISTSEINQNRR